MQLEVDLPNLGQAQAPVVEQLPAKARLREGEGFVPALPFEARIPWLPPAQRAPLPPYLSPRCLPQRTIPARRLAKGANIGFADPLYLVRLALGLEEEALGPLGLSLSSLPQKKKKARLPRPGRSLACCHVTGCMNPYTLMALTLAQFTTPAMPLKGEEGSSAARCALRGCGHYPHLPGAAPSREVQQKELVGRGRLTVGVGWLGKGRNGHSHSRDGHLLGCVCFRPTLTCATVKGQEA